MKIIEKKDNEVVFVVDINESLANTIRRYVNEIPVLAIDDVELSKNDSPLYDETIAHRLGLIPLNSEKVDTKKLPRAKLSAKEGFVMSDEIKGVDIPYKNMPITFLNKGQELELSATTKLGTGSEHSKFSPGIMFYRKVNELSLDKNLKEEVKKIFPEIEIKESGSKIIIIDEGKKEVTDIVEGICRQKGKEIEVKPKEEVVVTIESFGQIPVKDIFTGSISELKKDLNEVSKKIK